MSDDRKPVDLVDMRRCAETMRGRDQYAAAVRIDDMATELEAWREVATALIAGARGDYDGDPAEQRRVRVRANIDRMRTLLPSSKLDDARKRFEESMRPVERATKPTAEEVKAWGEAFEASAVRRPRKVCPTCGQYPGLCGHPLPPS